MANILNNLFNAEIMPDTLMTLRDLRVQTFKERREGRLTKLSNNFYSKLKHLEVNIRKFIDRDKIDQQRNFFVYKDDRPYSERLFEYINNELPIYLSNSRD